MHQIDPMKRERATAVLVDFCHTKLRFQEKKIFLALPWENHRILIWQKKSNFIISASIWSVFLDFSPNPDFFQEISPEMVWIFI